MSESGDEKMQSSPPEKRSLFGVIVHSFFIIPFLIAVFSVLLFASVRMLTMEKKTIYDYLEDVKVGGLTKRWQAAFELSKVLSRPQNLTAEPRFVEELQKAFEHSQHDDDRVRQYLALALGRTKNEAFATPLTAALPTEKEMNLPALIYAIGMIGKADTAPLLHPFLEHRDPQIRLAATMALGNIGNNQSLQALQTALQDSEPNISWEAAVSLAKMKDASGKQVLMNLLNRDYLAGFPEVDYQEQTHILKVAIQAASELQDLDIHQKIEALSKSDPNMNVRKIALETLEIRN